MPTTASFFLYLKPLLTTGFHALPGTIGGAIAGYGTARLGDFAKRRDRLKEEHLQELKDELLSVLLARLTTYYRPTCEGRRGIVDRSVQQIQRTEKSISDNRYLRSEFKLVVSGIYPETGDIFQRSSSPVLFSAHFDRLADDAKRIHYQSIMAAWDSLRTDFEAAAREHLTYVEHLAETLRTSLKLPPQTASPNDHKTWVSYENLARFIYEFQLGINPAHLTSYNHSAKNVVASGTQEALVECATPEEAQAALKMINHLAEDSSGLKGPLHSMKSLHPRILKLETAIKEAIAETKLPSKCPYC